MMGNAYHVFAPTTNPDSTVRICQKMMIDVTILNANKVQMNAQIDPESSSSADICLSILNRAIGVPVVASEVAAVGPRQTYVAVPRP
jgi:hypothetical protein